VPGTCVSAQAADYQEWRNRNSESESMDTYPSNIPSIAEKHPNLPAILTNVLNLDSRIHAGQPIARLAAKKAENTVGILEHHQGKVLP
jgi:hypothetical protein